MSVLLFPWPPQYDGGAYTLNNGFRNGVAPPGQKMRGVCATYANAVGVQRQKILFKKSIRYTEAYNTVTAADTWRCQFHTSPNIKDVEVLMVLGRIDHNPVGGGALNSRVRWTTTPSGGGPTNQDYIYHYNYNSASAVIVPDDMISRRQRWGLSGDTTYTAQLRQEDKLRVLSATIFEVPKTAVLSTDTNIIDPSPYYETGPIYDAAANEFQTVLTKLWKTMGTHHFAWCADADTGQTVTSATFTNLIDGTTTAYGANTQGFITWPNYHGSLETVDSGANTEGIPVTIYAWLQTMAGGTAECRFVDGTGTIGTLTSTSTSGEWVSSNVVWTVDTTATTEKIDVSFRNTVGTKQTTCFAAGMYEYEA